MDCCVSGSGLLSNLIGSVAGLCRTFPRLLCKWIGVTIVFDWKLPRTLAEIFRIATEFDRGHHCIDWKCRRSLRDVLRIVARVDRGCLRISLEVSEHFARRFSNCCTIRSGLALYLIGSIKGLYEPFSKFSISLSELFAQLV